jgi:hypothetical protein
LIVGANSDVEMLITAAKYLKLLYQHSYNSPNNLLVSISISDYAFQCLRYRTYEEPNFFPYFPEIFIWNTSSIRREYYCSFGYAKTYMCFCGIKACKFAFLNQFLRTRLLLFGRSIITFHIT